MSREKQCAKVVEYRQLMAIVTIGFFVCVCVWHDRISTLYNWTINSRS